MTTLYLSYPCIDQNNAIECILAKFRSESATPIQVSFIYQVTKISISHVPAACTIEGKRIFKITIRGTPLFKAEQIFNKLKSKGLLFTSFEHHSDITRQTLLGTFWEGGAFNSSIGSTRYRFATSKNLTVATVK